MRVYVYYVGKPRDAHLNAFADEFLKRAGRYCQCEMREIDPNRFDPWTKHPAAAKILLDPAGRSMTSEEFAKLFENAEMIGQDQVFIVGGHDGLPQEWRKKGDLLLSLSAMTFPHELARAILVEQIYRAFTILRGHPYPR